MTDDQTAKPTVSETLDRLLALSQEDLQKLFAEYTEGDLGHLLERAGYFSKFENAIVSSRDKMQWRALLKQRDQWQAQAEKLAEALNWIGAIAVSPRNSWPSLETCGKHANEALAEFEKFKEGVK